MKHFSQNDLLLPDELKHPELKQFLPDHNMKTVGRRLMNATLVLSLISAVITGCHKKKESKLDMELDQLRDNVPAFISIKNGTGLGYNKEVTGYRTQMGFHYLNEKLLDDKFEIDKPELLLYAPYGNDSLKFVAVEYATPIADIHNPPPVPEGFTGKDDVWEINTEFNLWTLHVWVGLENPHGIFAPHNPKLP